MPSTLQIVRFGPFALDLRSAELHRNGTTTQLAEQPFQVLTALLERPGEVVTRDELQQRLWGAETFGDFEHGLNAAVKRLREVLGDSAENPRYIETLPRHGYRFMAPVEGATKRAFALRAPAAVLPYLVIAGLASLLIALMSFLVWRPKHRTDVPEKRITLAVLPFENTSREPRQEFFSDSVTEELINWLGRVDAQHLGVIAATSAMKYKNSAKKAGEIGRELGVDYILEGSVLREESRTRITAQLIRVKDQTHLWAESYERDSRDILVMQTDIARAVAQQIRLTLTPQAQQQFSRARRVNPDAYLDYLRGQLENPKFTFEAMAKEQAYYERALQKDPNFALAYFGLANCYLNYMQTRRLAPGEAAKRTKEFVTKALEIDENLGEAYGVLAFTNWRYDWDVQAAERNFQRAIELSPNSVHVRMNHTTYLAWRGRRTEAFAEREIVRQLDPLRLEAGAHPGLIYYQLRDYGPMLEAMRQYVPSNPGHWLGHNLLGVAYQGSGQTLLAIPEYQKAVEYSGNDSDPVAALAYAYARTGNRAEAAKTLRNLLEQSKTSYVSPYMIATIYAGLGNKDKAFEFLAKAYDERSTDLSYFLKSDLRMDTLRFDPRFQDLLGRMGLPP
ncbi:MAG TPA: winged helix-turn-helix domain-containing protein [Terriglobales bacterium]|nr:winged helix-turn-helix domain-containing protein [Terriglobales bacterium]